MILYIFTFLNFILDLSLFVPSVKSPDSIFIMLCGFILTTSLSLTPYYVMRRWLRTPEQSKRLGMTVVWIVSLLGMYAKYDIAYLDPDPQGAIAYMFVPVIQLFVLGIWYLLVSFMSDSQS